MNKLTSAEKAILELLRIAVDPDGLQEEKEKAANFLAKTGAINPEEMTFTSDFEKKYPQIVAAAHELLLSVRMAHN